MIRILVVDDHTVVREGLKHILADQDDLVIVGEVESGHETLHAISSCNCDMVLLDISMPGRSGLEILEDIRMLWPNLPVIILSVHPEEQYAIRAFMAAASGYLTKACAANELIGAIRKVSRGGKYVSELLAAKLAADLGNKGDQKPHERLSNREFQVMRMLASGKSGREIAAELCLSVKTVSTYKIRVMDKMGMKRNAELIFYALKHEIALT